MIKDINPHWHPLLKKQLQRLQSKSVDGEMDCSKFLDLVDDEYKRADNEQDLLNRSTILMADELYNSNQKLFKKAAQLKSILDSTPTAILNLNNDGTINTANAATFEMFQYSEDELIGHSITRLFPEDTPMECLLSSPDTNSLKADALINRHEHKGTKKNGDTIYVEIIFSDSIRNDSENNTIIINDITLRISNQNEIQDLNEKLVENARLAGMSEVATSVLHNVGNVLNSINVSATLIEERVKGCRAENLAILSNLILEHQDNLGDFIMHDERGKNIPAYIKQLSSWWVNEKLILVDEIKEMNKSISHVKDIIKGQQSLSGITGNVQEINLDKLISNAVQINRLKDKNITLSLKKNTEKPILLLCEKSKIGQIIINLITNAIDSVEESTKPQKCIDITLLQQAENCIIRVSDNGKGISEDNLKKMFTFGFTTKPTGHGFGLHSSILSAKEMGGNLTASSPGPNLGATFELTLPFRQSKKETL